MANLVITSSCNLSCPFCFASEYMPDGDGRPAERMSLETLAEHLRFIGDGDARFCGGEPTTHPEFVQMLRMALARPRGQVFLMTNGVWPESVRRAVAGLSAADVVRVRYLVNILPPDLYTDAQWRELRASLEVMHPLAVTLGMTFYRAAMPYAHLLELARRMGITRLRFSVASPNTTDPRSWNLEPARDFPVLAGVVVNLVKEARAAGLTVHSDCGYIPPCMFTEEQRAVLAGDGTTPPAMEYACHGPVDISPTGEAWRCYGLYNVVRGHVDDYEDAAQMGDDFERRTHELSQHFMFDACADCDWRARGECMGGCFAYRVTRSMKQRAETEGLLQIGLDASLAGIMPRRDEDAVHARAGGTAMLRERGTGSWVPLALSPVEQRVLHASDGTRTVGEIARSLETEGVLRHAGPAVSRAVRRLYESGALQLVRSA